MHFFRSSDTTMIHNDQLMGILVPIIIIVFITFAVIAVVYCWRKRKYIFWGFFLLFLLKSKMILFKFDLFIRTDLIQ